MDDRAARATNISTSDSSRAQARVLLVGRQDTLTALEGTLHGHPFELVGPLWPAHAPLGSRADPVDAALIDIDSSPVAYDWVLQLSESAFPCRSIVLGSHLDRASVREAFLAGVVACLRKPVDGRVLAAALRRAVDATWVMRRCIEEADAEGPDAELCVPMGMASAPTDLSMLTRRESEILELVLEGHSTRLMAAHLSVTERTVKFHVSNVLRKLGVDSRLALLAKLRRRDTW